MIEVNEELEKKLNESPLYSKDGQGLEAEVIAKFFMPLTAATWLITEASKEGDDWLMYGYCHICCWEFGYVRLSEILSLNISGITAERDLFLPDGATIQDCLKSFGYAEE